MDGEVWGVHFGRVAEEDGEEPSGPLEPHGGVGIGVTCCPGDLISGLSTDTHDDPALFDEMRAYVMGEGVHDVTRVILRRAADRGQVESGLPTARILRLPIDLLRNEYLMSRGPLPADTVTGIIDDIVMPLLRTAMAGQSRLR
ncbi:TetR-like C-terminal domain-containing protein [Marinactinospora rubrisoli]|uniref:TetR-like C-terminal domain-containing protein n=1 Tax=Marinactinospora rubrisoli TaxID=2715399 RepID=A0ABW2KEG0_9ACTN